MTNPGAAYFRERYARLDHVGKVRHHRTRDVRKHLGFAHRGPDWNQHDRDQMLAAHARLHDEEMRLAR
jgi:hypothetical protein